MSLNIFGEVVPTSIESIMVVMFIVVAGLFFGSMANRAIQVALNRTKL